VTAPHSPAPPERDASPTEVGPPPTEVEPPPTEVGAPPAETTLPSAQPRGEATLPSARPEAEAKPRAEALAETILAAPSAQGRAPAPDDASALRQVEEGSYVVDGELGRGGLGRVLYAHDPCLRRPVALKEVLRRDPGTVARFVREARITARLQHPNIVPVYEAGRWPNGDPFYAMRLVSGRPLGEVVDAMPTIEERLSLIPSLVAVADAVAYAHSQRIVHRDLKPDNVLVGAFGETVVIDWGLAKDLAAEEADVATPGGEGGGPGKSALTVVGTRVGTPAYMAPEQARGEPVDERADVFALGALMYHVLVGEAPYRGPSVEDVLSQAARSEPVDVEAREPSVPRDLAPIVRKAMARLPADRYPTARELADDLRRFQTAELVSARRYTRSELFARWIRRHRVAVAVALVSIATLAVTSTLSVRRIIAEKDRAEARTGELILAQARLSLETDPTAAIAWLGSYPEGAPGWDAARLVAVDARGRGVARHAFAVPGQEEPAALAFQDGGERLAALVDGRILAFRLATGASVPGAVAGRDGPAAFLGGASSLVVASKGGALDLFSAGGGPSRRIGEVGSAVRAIVASADGRWLAAAGDGAVVMVSASGDVHRRLAAPPSGVASLALAPDGKLLAAAAEDRSAWVWNLGSGRSHALEGRLTKLSPIVFVPGKPPRLIGAGEDGALLLWSPPAVEARRLPGDPHRAVLLAVSADGTRAATADDVNEVRVWDLASGEARLLGAHGGQVMALAFSPGGDVLASTAQDETLRLWSLATSEPAVIHGHAAIDRPLVFSPDGRWIATAGGGQIRVWPARPPAGRTLRGHDARVTHAVFSPDGRLVATCGETHVLLWDVATGRLVRSGAHDAEVYGLAFSPDGKILASASFDGTARLWDTQGDGVRVLSGHDGRVRDVAFSPDGRTLVTPGQDGTVRLWDVTGTDAPRILGRFDGPAGGAAFSSDGRLVAASGRDGSLRVWDLATFAERRLGAQPSGVHEVHFLPGPAVLGVTPDDAWIWDLGTGRPRALPHLPAFGGRVEVSPDGRLLALPHGDRIRLLDLATGEERDLHGNDRDIQRCRFSHDGRRIASVGLDQTVRVFDVATGAVRVVHRHEGVVFDVSFSPDDRLIASAAGDKTAWVGPAGDDDGDALPPDPAAVRAALPRWTSARVTADNLARTP
jgi:WD40 repeat protein